MILGAWFVGSVVHQLGLIRSDRFGLIPRWTFFAPNPGREDTHVIFRDKENGRWCSWQTLTPAASRPAWRWLWNPQRFPRKAAADLANGMRRSASHLKEVPRALLLSNSYVAILRWVMEQPRSRESTHRQFAIVTSRGFAEQQHLDILFLSEPHIVEH
jgi:hypothetical protein